jgi:hypothetical protein
LAIVGVVVVLVVVGSLVALRKKSGAPAGAIVSRQMMKSVAPGAAAPEAAGMGEVSASIASDQEAEGGQAASSLLSKAEAAMPRREIIYTGDMQVEVDDVEAAARQVAATAVSAGGWVSDQKFVKDSEGRGTATVILRLPAARFGPVHDAMLKLGEVIRDSTSSQDVGKEFVDLESRLTNLRREETVIAALFDREGKIEAVLQVERELARVRGQIEQIQGQLRYLKDQVGFSTLTVTLRPKRPAIERKMESWNLGYHLLRAWRALVAIARGLTYAVIYTVIVAGPFVLIAWLVWWAIRAARRRRPPAAG